VFGESTTRDVLLASLCVLGALFIVAELVTQVDRARGYRRTRAEIDGLPTTDEGKQ
jgi:hypothetical protein